MAAAMMSSHVISIVLYLLVRVCTYSLPIPTSSGQRVLLIGDSIDRYMVYEDCFFHNVTTRPWGDNSLSYVRDFHLTLPSSVCELDVYNYSIAQVQIFGSLANGPYLWIDPRDMSTRTAPRVKRALDLYYQEFGAPNAVFFSTILWDLRPFHVNGGLNATDEKFNGTVASMKKEVIDRLYEIRDKVGPHVEIGLRTSAYCNTPGHPTGEMITAYNHAYREIAHEHHFSLIDIDRDAWSILNYNYSMGNKILLRDEVHPRQGVLVAAAEKIAGRRYTSVYSRTNSSSCKMKSASISVSCIYKMNHHHAHSLHAHKDLLGHSHTKNFTEALDFLINPNVVVKLIQSLHYKHHSSVVKKHGLQYLMWNHTTLLRWNNITDAFLHSTLLGVGDILYLSHEDMKIVNASVPLVGSVPNELSELTKHPTIGVITTAKTMYFVYEDTARLMLSSQLLHYFVERNVAPIFENVEEMWIPTFFTVGESSHDKVLAKILRNSSLIRFDKEHQCYVVIETPKRPMQKRPIPSIGVFVKYGWDFDDVIVVKDREVFDYLVTGAELE